MPHRYRDQFTGELVPCQIQQSCRHRAKFMEEVVLCELWEFGLHRQGQFKGSSCSAFHFNLTTTRASSQGNWHSAVHVSSWGSWRPAKTSTSSPPSPGSNWSGTAHVSLICTATSPRWGCCSTAQVSLVITAASPRTGLTLSSSALSPPRGTGAAPSPSALAPPRPVPGGTGVGHHQQLCLCQDQSQEGLVLHVPCRLRCHLSIRECHSCSHPCQKESRPNPRLYRHLERELIAISALSSTCFISYAHLKENPPPPLRGKLLLLPTTTAEKEVVASEADALPPSDILPPTQVKEDRGSRGRRGLRRLLGGIH